MVLLVLGHPLPGFFLEVWNVCIALEAVSHALGLKESLFTQCYGLNRKRVPWDRVWNVSPPSGISISKDCEVGPTSGNKCVGMRIWRLLPGPWLWIHSAPCLSCCDMEPSLTTFTAMTATPRGIKLSKTMNQNKSFFFFFQIFSVRHFVIATQEKLRHSATSTFIPQSLTLAPSCS